MRVTGVSFSSDKKLSRCEQMYSYRYDRGLKIRVKAKGLYMGDWMHQLQEAHYRKEDWREKFKAVKKAMWDKLFEEEQEMYEEKGFTPQLAYDLQEHWVEHWADEESKWQILHVEKSFILPTKIGIPVRWKSDLIVKAGRDLVLVERKNKEKMPDSEERILAPQVHAYCFLLSKAGIRITKILWDYICTKPATKPKILKNGTISKRKIITDQRTYLKAIKEAGIHPKGDEVIGLENYLKTLPETVSLKRVSRAVNLEVGEQFVRDWLERARRAQSIKRPLRTFVRGCKWDCDYFELCQKELLGEATKGFIQANFVTHIKEAE